MWATESLYLRPSLHSKFSLTYIFSSLKSWHAQKLAKAQGKLARASLKLQSTTNIAVSKPDRDEDNLQIQDEDGNTDLLYLFDTLNETRKKNTASYLSNKSSCDDRCHGNLTEKEKVCKRPSLKIQNTNKSPDWNCIPSPNEHITVPHVISFFLEFINLVPRACADQRVLSVEICCCTGCQRVIVIDHFVIWFFYYSSSRFGQVWEDNGLLFMVANDELWLISKSIMKDSKNNIFNRF